MQRHNALLMDKQITRGEKVTLPFMKHYYLPADIRNLYNLSKENIARLSARPDAPKVERSVF